ncbi:MAG TPA: universal stress protein [Sandaracinaceae bacterium LLY-WYZ-13_1]|nr:universal stress protein [Sandaracinaceae bacterium LLY-WYZ-13_1]
MSTPSDATAARPHVIVAATDFSEISNLALQQAWSLATQRQDAQLHVIHVVDAHRGLRSKSSELERESELLETLPGELRNHAIQQAQVGKLPPLHQPLGVHVRIGEPAGMILQLAADLDAAMVVVGSHGRSGLDKLLLGSVSEKLVKAGRLPVLVSRPKHLEGMARSEKLEPPCPDCIAVRHRSGGNQWWCEVHGRPHTETHVYSASENVRFSKAPMDFEGALTGGR